MNFKRVIDNNTAEFKAAIQIYEASFPINEKRALNDQIEALSDDSYHFQVIHNDNLETMGLLLNWETEDFVYIEHFAILESARGQNLGGRILEKIKSEKNIPIILEIDPPVDDISKRRMDFYKRHGFTMTKYKHLQPTYKEHDETCTLNVMAYPNIDEKLYNIFYDFIINKVFYYSFSRRP